MNYTERILLPVVSESDIAFRTSTGLLVANGYLRVVVGGRGPYIEFDDNQIVRENIKLQKIEQDGKFHWFYDEYRTIDSAFVKLYHQKKTVDYADYRIGYWYIDPAMLTSKEYPVLIKPLKEQPDLIEF